MTDVVALGSTVIAVAAIGLWLHALLEVAHFPEWQFDVAESNKLFWIVVIVVFNAVGALLWHLTARARVIAADDGRFEADDELDDAPAGWYSQPGAAALRWWDGSRWTDRYDTWSGAPS
ncbi:MAG TPA: DUF2510 domain-containing protein [Candidatus Dormibacteraeota bacterium]